MKNSEVLQLNNKINHYSNELRNLKGAKFSYGLIKNTNILQKECKDIVSVLTSSDAYKIYDKKRLELCQKFAKKDEKGEIIKTNVKEDGTFDFDINVNDIEWIKEITELKEQHKEAIAEQDKKIEEYNQFLENESTIQFYKININDVPDEISVELMSVINVLID